LQVCHLLGPFSALPTSGDLLQLLQTIVGQLEAMLAAEASPVGGTDTVDAVVYLHHVLETSTDWSGPEQMAIGRSLHRIADKTSSACA
jgi:hypothetical protein